jgi:hypothetical protein
MTMNTYESGRCRSAVQEVGILLCARPTWVRRAMADRRSRVALAVADVAEAATGRTDAGPESHGLLALARHGHDVAAAVDWLAGDRGLPARVVGSLADTGAVVATRPAAGWWRPRTVEADPATLAGARSAVLSRPRRPVLLALVVAELAPRLPGLPILDAQRRAAVLADPLFPALKAGTVRYLRRRGTEDAVASIGGVAGG